MPSGWRIVNARHAGSAFSGDGARRFGGRWNSPGQPMVYLAAYQSLAILEILAHTQPTSPREEYQLIPASWDEALMEKLGPRNLPADWTALPFSPTTAAIGDRWLKEARSVILAVPSVVVPSENNFLLNPRHPDFRKVKIGKPVSFYFDPRLLPPR